MRASGCSRDSRRGVATVAAAASRLVRQFIAAADLEAAIALDRALDHHEICLP